MSDVTKLKRQAAKAAEACAAACGDMHAAIERWGILCATLGVANEAVEHAEALATALELRGKKD